nr:hypothetical protein [Segetibacter sp.]
IWKTYLCSGNFCSLPTYALESYQFLYHKILDKTLFGVIDVFGKKQLTYKGWPLYYFGQDAQVRGANKGISFPSPAVWPVVGKDTPTAPQ